MKHKHPQMAVRPSPAKVAAAPLSALKITSLETQNGQRQDVALPW